MIYSAAFDVNKCTLLMLCIMRKNVQRVDIDPERIHGSITFLIFFRAKAITTLLSIVTAWVFVENKCLESQRFYLVLRQREDSSI